MEELTEAPAKKRKIEDASSEKAESNLASENQENSNPVLKPKPILQIKTASLARLRQAARNLSPSKNNQNKDNVTPITTPDKNQKAGETKEHGDKEETGPTNGVGNDVIISSTGSSPAHSPKPEDLTVLSTPPRQSKVLGMKADVSKNLSERFESLEKSGKQEDNLEQTGKEDSEVKENAFPSKKSDKDAEMMEVDKKEDKEIDVAEETRKENNTTKEKPKMDFNATELKKVLRAMIDEKFKQVEDFFQAQEPESELYSRIARLEEENKSIQEYAAKLEKAVKLLLDNQQMKKEKMTSQWVQTEQIIPPRPSSAPSKTVTPPTSHTTSQINQVNKPGNPSVVTSRLTSTQAPIPGHSLRPDSYPQQRVVQQQQQVRPPSQLQPQRPPPPRPQYVQRPPPPQTRTQYVPPPVVAQAPVGAPRRPTPVTVTVHPQTTPQTSKTNMNLSPAYPNHAPKPSYTPNVTIPQSVPRAPQFVPIPVNRPPAAPVVMHHGQTSQPLPGIVSRPPPPQQGLPVQRPPQGIKQYSNSVGLRSPPNPRPGTVTSMHPMQGQVVNNSLVTSPRSVQSVVSPSTNRQPNPQGMTVVSPREQGLAPNAQTGTNSITRDVPPRPIVSIAVVSNGIVLSWNMQSSQNSARIVRYQLFALQDMGANNPPSQWKKIGVVNALPLPMACTLTQFMPGNKYHFTVRAQDEHGHCGPLSEPCTITLT